MGEGGFLPLDFFDFDDPVERAQRAFDLRIDREILPEIDLDLTGQV